MEAIQKVRNFNSYSNQKEIMTLTYYSIFFFKVT